MIEYTQQAPVSAIPWPLRAVAAAADLAETLKALHDLENRFAQAQAINERLSRSLQAVKQELIEHQASTTGHGELARLRVERDEANANLYTLGDELARERARAEVLEAQVSARDAEREKLKQETFRYRGMLDVAEATLKRRAEIGDPVPAEAAAPKSYRPICRTCKKPFECVNANGKKCDKCKDESAAKPARPIAPVKDAKPKAKMGRPPKPMPVTPDLSDEADEKPIAPNRNHIACASCSSAKRNQASDTGWECTLSRFRECMPWTFAHLKNWAPKESA